MKKKYLVGYCWTCCKKTKQEIIRCDMPIVARLFLGIASMGVSEACGYSYQCECTKCGETNNIHT